MDFWIVHSHKNLCGWEKLDLLSSLPFFFSHSKNLMCSYMKSLYDFDFMLRKGIKREKRLSIPYLVYFTTLKWRFRNGCQGSSGFPAPCLLFPGFDFRFYILNFNLELQRHLQMNAQRCIISTPVFILYIACELLQFILSQYWTLRESCISKLSQACTNVEVNCISNANSLFWIRSNCL